MAKAYNKTWYLSLYPKMLPRLMIDGNQSKGLHPSPWNMFTLNSWWHKTELPLKASCSPETLLLSSPLLWSCCAHVQELWSFSPIFQTKIEQTLGDFLHWSWDRNVCTKKLKLFSSNLQKATGTTPWSWRFLINLNLKCIFACLT